jgi:uncharacterized membrane protein YdjX (TVP38/TMEM64 family)
MSVAKPLFAMSGPNQAGVEPVPSLVKRVRTWPERRIHRVLIAVVVLTALVVVIWLTADRFEWRAGMDRVITTLREAGPGPFFGAMAVLPGLGFPLSAFLAVAGPVFGPTMGVGLVIACAIAAITVNVAWSYWAAARVLRPVAKWIVQRLGYGLPEISSGAAWSAILILRIVPGIPFFLQSLLLGLARVSFGPYLLVSVLVPAAYVTAMITLGDALIRGDRLAMAGAGALFFVAGGIIDQVRRYLLRRAQKAVPPAASENRIQ